MTLLRCVEGNIKAIDDVFNAYHNKGHVPAEIGKRILMEDFLVNAPYEKEICESCKHDYLQSPDCEKCRIDKFIEALLDNWYNLDEFQRSLMYEGINLGDLARYELQMLLASYFLKTHG